MGPTMLDNPCVNHGKADASRSSQEGWLVVILDIGLRALCHLHKVQVPARTQR